MIKKESMKNPGFRSLAGIEPGVSRLTEMVAQYGEVEKREITPVEEVCSHSFGGNLVLHWVRKGISAVISSAHASENDPIIEAIYIYAPNLSEGPGGLIVGQAEESARKIINSQFYIAWDLSDSLDVAPDNISIDNLQVWFEGARLIRIKLFPALAQKLIN